MMMKSNAHTIAEERLTAFFLGRASRLPQAVELADAVLRLLDDAGLTLAEKAGSAPDRPPSPSAADQEPGGATARKVKSADHRG